MEMRTELASGVTVGDPVLLEHLVSNLVDNAIKHNVGDGGRVWVRTGVLEGFATVQVENTGPVVPAYEVDRLFEQATGLPGFQAAIDLRGQTLTPAGAAPIGFEVEAARKHRLLNGLDDIALTLQRADRIRAFEAQHRTTEPWLFT